MFRTDPHPCWLRTGCWEQVAQGCCHIVFTGRASRRGPRGWCWQLAVWGVQGGFAV